MAAAALHLGLAWQVGGLGTGTTVAAASAPQAPTALSVRTIDAAVRPVPPAEGMAAQREGGTEAAPAVDAPAPRRVRAPQVPAAAGRTAQVLPPAAPSEAREAAADAGEVAVPAQWVVPVAVEAPMAAAPDEAQVAPHYRTRAPAPFSLSYRLSRGGLHGHGALVWELDGGRYQLKLSGEVALFGNVLTQISSGTLDGHGLAPVRYTDQRLGRAAQAVNFQRGAGKISFSGPTTEYPLVDGVQDRLSWMVQLAAIAQADPALVGAHRKVTLLVAGPRGDLDAWTFIGQGAEAVAVGDQSVAALKLVREPRKPRDTGVEVWLDPTRQHLPARARLSDGGRESLDLHLQP